MTLLQQMLGRGGAVAWAVVGGLALVGIGAVDSSTDPNITFSLFYTIPVAMTAWRCPRATAFVFSIASAATWLAVDFVKGRFQPTLLASGWNFSSRLAFLLMLAVLFASLRGALARERESARKDYLTDTFNMRAFHELAEREIVRARRYSRPLTLIYLDVDDFKTVNDRLGHDAGDSLLRTIADVMKTSTRATDIVSRLGGDEFAILLSETEMEAARHFVGKLQSRLLEAVAANRWAVTFSIGVATTIGASESVADLVGREDRLMYAVKAHTKDGVCFSAPCSAMDPVRKSTRS